MLKFLMMCEYIRINFPDAEQVFDTLSYGVILEIFGYRLGVALYRAFAVYSLGVM